VQDNTVEQSYKCTNGQWYRHCWRRTASVCFGSQLASKTPPDTNICNTTMLWYLHYMDQFLHINYELY